jgi:Type II secretion system (T2SS), protein E, N-terminal domain
MIRKRIGELLVERGVLTREQLESGLAAQRQTRKRLGVTLLELGLLSEVHLAQALAESLQLATVDLAQVTVDWSAVHLLRATFCESHLLFPFAVEGKGTPTKRVLVALADPLDAAAVQEIEFTTGLEVAPFVSTHSQIRGAILRYYHKVTETPPPAMWARPASGLRPLPDDEPPTVVGEELPARATPASKTMTSVARDLDFLFGRTDEEEPVEKLERKFWTLMRILAKKGQVTREEFLKELDEP